MSKLADWLFGPRVCTKAEVMELIEAKERYHIQKFNAAIQLIKFGVHELGERVSDLESPLPPAKPKARVRKKNA